MTTTSRLPGRKVALALLALVLLTAPGCVRRDVREGVSDYGFETHLVLMAGSGGGLLVTIATLLGPQFARQRTGLFVGGLMLLYTAPCMYTDHIRVDTRGMSGGSGYWPFRSSFDIAYKDLKTLRVESVERRTKNGRTRDIYLSCQFKSGDLQRLEAGHVLKKAQDEIIHNARAYGVKIDYLDKPL